MSFHVGQRVVCVKPILGLKLNQIYTVRWIGQRPTDEAIGLMVAEYSGVNGFGIEWSFKLSRFRPIVSRKTDISALQALLVPGSKIRETA